MRRLGVIGVVVACLATAWAVEEPVDWATRANAFDPSLVPNKAAGIAVLAAAPRYSGPHVGIGGGTPNTVFAFRKLIAEPDAVAIFTRLTETATPAGQLYALAALGLLDPAVFAERVKPFRESDEEVETMSGCMVFAISMRSILADGKRAPFGNFADGSAARRLLPPESAAPVGNAASASP